MTKTTKQANFSLPIKCAVLIVLLFLVVVPILRMFSILRVADFEAVLTGKTFVETMLSSLWLSAVATLIVLALALLLAWSMTRTNMRGKRIFHVLLILPMLIPSISHGMGLIILFGGNGIFKNLFGLSGTIYGSAGIICGSVLYAFPVAYIMLADVLRYEDMSVYEAADILGIGKVRAFCRITLPYLKKPLIAAAFSTFSMIITDYGVPLMAGGKTKTIALVMYQEVIGQLNFGRGAVYGLFLLIPAIVAFLADLISKERASAAFVHRAAADTPHQTKDLAGFLSCTLVSCFALLPILSFLVLAFAKSYPRDMHFTLANIAETFDRGGGAFLWHSLLIALLTACLGTLLAYIAAYLSARMQGALSRAIHLLILTFLAIPGLVLGLSYVLTFKGTALVGTFAILILVNTAHFMASPYLMMHNTFGKMNENLESVGATLGSGRLRMLVAVFVPQSIATIAEMFSYLFVNCMMTISAVSFLANTKTKPLSLLINQFEAQMQFECAAVVSLLILLVNIVVKLIVSTAKSRAAQKKESFHATDKKTI